MLILLLFCMLTTNLFGAEQEQSPKKQCSARKAAVNHFNKYPDGARYKIKNDKKNYYVLAQSVLIDNSGTLACACSKLGKNLYRFTYPEGKIIGKERVDFMKGYTPCTKNTVLATDDRTLCAIQKQFKNKDGSKYATRTVGYTASGKHIIFYWYTKNFENGFLSSQKKMLTFGKKIDYKHCQNAGSTELDILTITESSAVAIGDYELEWHSISPVDSQKQ